MSKNNKNKQYPTISEDLLEEYQNAYDHFDLNKNGKLSKTEVSAMLKKLGMSNKPDEVQRVFEGLGKEKETDLTFDDYVQFMMQYNLTQNKYSTEDVVAAFQAFDKNHDGFLSKDEFRYILMCMGKKFSEAEVNEIFVEADLNKDGKLNYKEFVEYWQNQC